jgi:hypothetical protein
MIRCIDIVKKNVCGDIWTLLKPIVFVVLGIFVQPSSIWYTHTSHATAEQEGMNG